MAPCRPRGLSPTSKAQSCISAEFWLSRPSMWPLMAQRQSMKTPRWLLRTQQSAPISVFRRQRAPRWPQSVQRCPQRAPHRPKKAPGPWPKRAQIVIIGPYMASEGPTPLVLQGLRAGFLTPHAPLTFGLLGSPKRPLSAPC